MHQLTYNGKRLCVVALSRNLKTITKKYNMKYCKILITPLLWHLIPYKINHTISENKLTEFGFLCFKLIITNER